MKIACFDMEGTLTPEIWEQVALDTGIEGFNKTTRDIPDYGELMDFRLELMASNNLGISDMQKIFLTRSKRVFRLLFYLIHFMNLHHL